MIHEYYGQRTKANNDLNSFGNCVDKDLKETLEKLIQSVGSNLDQAVAASTIMTSSEKTVANNNSNAIKTSAKQMATLDDPIDISGNISCDSLLGSPNDSGSLYSLINTLFRYIQIIAPILLIVFGGVDFGKAVLSSDQEELKKAQARFIKRCIAALALFFLPYMVKWLMEQIMTHTGIIDWDACMPK